AEDAVHELLARREPVALQPEYDVRLAGHRTDLDLLYTPDHPRRHGRIDGVHQLRIVLPERFDYRRCVDACRRAKGVTPEDGIVLRNWHAGYLRDLVHQLVEPRQIARRPPQQHQVDENQVERRVSHALAD